MRKRDIILMNAPFTDLSEKKIRPALVLAQIKEDLLICFITSKKDSLSEHEVFVEADEKNKLRSNSVIKCNKIFTLHVSLSKGILGKISLEHHNAVVNKIREIIE